MGVPLYNERLEVINPGELHFGITPEKLKEPHESKPWNPLIANAFYRARIIERWGSGTTNIIDRCEENGNPELHWQVRAGSVVVTFLPIPESKTPQAQAPVEAHEAYDGAHEPMSDIECRILDICADGPGSTTELLQSLGYKSRTGNFKRTVSRLLEIRFLGMTIPTKPRSKKQRYRLTDAGKHLLKSMQGNKRNE